MKIILNLFLIFIISCTSKEDEKIFNNDNEIKYGPVVDRVIFEVRTDSTIAVKDIAEGRADLMSSGIDASTYLSIKDDERKKLDVYSTPSISWSLLFNPIPDKAPYTLKTKDNKTYFNPFSIREIRYAMNFLINRKEIVDEILRGAGMPSFTQATPNQPGTYIYNLIPTKLGMTETGDQNKAIKDINQAMEGAANLPENRGRLVKKNGWWTFDNNIVTVKFVIRVDDPQGRLPLGNTVTELIEKTGIKVEKLLYDRNKVSQIVYNSDPKNYEWNIVTEGWGAGATRAWWDVSLRQMYVREGNTMPGWNIADFWNYDNREAERISTKNASGWFLSSDEYWSGNIRLQEIGLKESVRIYIASQTQFFVANKERLKNRMIYGTGDGINEWSIRTADVKPDKNGEKVLRVIQQSAYGSLFTTPWDPIGVNGFGDIYSGMIIGACSDANSAFESPSTAKTEYILGEVLEDSLKISLKKDSNGGEKPIGLIDVDDDAEVFNPYTGEWEKGLVIREINGEIKYVKEANRKVYASAEFKPKYFKWHHGVQSSMVDLVYGSVFIANIITKTNENDKYYDMALKGRYGSGIDGSVGGVIKEDSLISFIEFYFPMDKNRQLSGFAAGPKIANPNRNTLIPFEINEAIMKMVVEGSLSKTVYTISQDQSLTAIDVKNPTCVSDIRDKLEEMIKTKYLPSGIERWITVEEAIIRYKKAIEFIDKYKHAYISNGPFFISKIDTKANYIELKAFRDYNYKSDYWYNKLSKKMTLIEDVEIKSIVRKNEDLNIDVLVSTYNYPYNTMSLADNNVNVRISLQLKNGGEKVYNGVFENDSFKVTIDRQYLETLPSGDYILIIESFIDDETPNVLSKTFILQ